MFVMFWNKTHGSLVGISILHLQEQEAGSVKITLGCLLCLQYLSSWAQLHYKVKLASNASVYECYLIKVERCTHEQIPPLVLEENYLIATILKCFKEILESDVMYLNEATLLNGRWEMARKMCSHVTRREKVRGLLSSLLHFHWVTECWHAYGSGRVLASGVAAILVPPTPLSIHVSKGHLHAAPILNNPPSVCLLKQETKEWMSTGTISGWNKVVSKQIM